MSDLTSTTAAGQAVWLRAYVEKLLREAADDRPVQADEDGDFPFPWGTAMGWVQVVDGDPPLVRVMAHAAYGLRPTAALRKEIDEINARATYAKVFLSGGHLVVTYAMPAESLSVSMLQRATVHVGSVAEDIGGLAAAVFGGQTPFDPEPVEQAG
jgi:hypothetical protein